MTASFDESTLTEVAHLICGDDGPLVYRQGWELPEFFRRADWSEVPEHDGTPRHQWTTALLNERRLLRPEEVEQAVLRLANPREYHGQEKEYRATVDRLNQLLLVEGWRVDLVRGMPVLSEQDPVFGARIVPRVELQVSISQVVDDPELAAAVQRRLDEARTCYENGAYIATIIMLGSLLEGVLLHAASSRSSTSPLPKPLDRLGLQDLVQFAHVNGWIDLDAKMAFELVRHYRNSVHPHREVRSKHSPDRDTVDLCWPVVNATLNDLAAGAEARRA
ncbi:hypothetical protein OG948_05895 [Embleya sp. NBC_00888]|uniref:hypothetical protein n=1 Tax=Embleya sp. NBC_00888 TaxID=2975960 RepID=UPI00386779C3|nr:hypothetical protein OG948_05895 [Embleya sp. NBC_00888]